MPVIARTYAGNAPQPQRWLAYPYLARDVMTLGAGGAGILKGTSMASVIADVTTGRDFFGGMVPNELGPAEVVGITPEDRRDAMKFRLGAADADLSMVFDFTHDGRIGEDGLPGKTRLDFDGLRRLRSLTAWINRPEPEGGRGGRVGLVYIDPLMAVKPRGVAVSQNDQSRDHIVDPLDSLAAWPCFCTPLPEQASCPEHGCAVLLLQHTVKDGSIGGSQGLVDAARLVLMFARNKAHPGYASLRVCKSNIGPDDAPALNYRQVGAEGGELTRRVEWTGELTAEEPVIVADSVSAPPTPIFPYQRARDAVKRSAVPSGLPAAYTRKRRSS